MTFIESSQHKLGEIIKTITPPKKIPTSEYLEVGDFPIIDQSAPLIAGWTKDSQSLVYPPEEGVIIFGDHTCVLKFVRTPFAQGADGIKIIQVTGSVIPHYVYAHLKAFPLSNDGYKRHFSEFKELPIAIPDPRVQGAISGLLQILETKMDQNRIVSKTLESIAHTLFRSWFVDFDPVRAKMAGEKPAGMDDATAALFPDSMVESELGEIPDGWEFRTVDSILLRHPTQALPNSTPLERRGATLVLEQGNQVVAGFTSLEPDVVATGQSPKFIFGDHTCRMRLATIPFSVFPNTVVLYSSVVDTYWCFLATLGLQQFESYRRHWSELKIRNVILPNPELTWAFGEVVAPMFEQCDALLLQNALLSTIRDNLLPRLISGELEVPESLLVS